MPVVTGDLLLYIVCHINLIYVKKLPIHVEENIKKKNQRCSQSKGSKKLSVSYTFGLTLE